jgi:hypothetical protein
MTGLNHNFCKLESVFFFTERLDKRIRMRRLAELGFWRRDYRAVPAVRIACDAFLGQADNSGGSLDPSNALIARLRLCD